MKIGEDFNNAKNDRNYDLNNMEDRKEVLQYVKGGKAKMFPSLTEMLIGRTRIFDAKNTNLLAYTAFNYRTTFFEIYINFEKIEKEKYNFNFLQFLVYHELMHNFFRHFTRPFLEEYRKKNADLLNILEDVVINEYLCQCLKLLDKKNEKELNFNYKILQEQFPHKKLEIKNNEIMSVEQLIIQFKEEFEESEKFQNQMKKILEQMKGLDDHELSSELSKVIGEENESVGEGEGSSGSNKTQQEIKEQAAQSELKNEQIDDMVKNAIMEIIESGKMKGSQCSREEQRLFDIITKKETAFDFIKIKNIIKNALGTTPIRTYKKIHRHKEFFTGIPLKGKIFTQPKRLVFAIDTSGSVSDKEMNVMMSILFNYKKKHKDVIIDVIAWSSSLDNHYKNVNEEKEIKKMKMGSTGGTVIKFLFDCLEKEYPNEKLSVVVITDGLIDNPTYNAEIINDLYFGLTANTEAEVKTMYPLAKIVNIKIEY